MDELFEIRSSAFPNDMSQWCSEKMSSVVRSLASISETIGGQSVVSEDVLHVVKGELSSALNDATKMLAFSYGAQWSRSDRDMIVRNGVLGYQEVHARYDRRELSLLELVAQLREHVSGEPAPSRTLMHDLLCHTSFDEPLLQLLEEELERVTMGEVDWNGFVPRASAILDQIQEKAARM